MGPQPRRFGVGGGRGERGAQSRNWMTVLGGSSRPGLRPSPRIGSTPYRVPLRHSIFVCGNRWPSSVARCLSSSRVHNVSWKDLKPDLHMLAALDAADSIVPRATAVSGDRAPRHAWSNAFADACAKEVAAEFAVRKAFKKFTVLPKRDGTSEPPTFVAGGKQKKLDVAVASGISGLQVAVSLKGMNFRDKQGHQFDKNLTGRTYELRDEVKIVHEYQPAAIMVALYFLPIGATCDKTSRAPSSFARTVLRLRSNTGRLDNTLPSQWDRADMGFVGLYVPGDEEKPSGSASYADELARGVVRYFDVNDPPPRRGRPVVKSTLDLEQMVERIEKRFRGEDQLDPAEWADPEPES